MKKQVTNLKPYIFLALGLLLGALGASMFVQSKPPEKDTAEKTIAELEVKLKKSKNRVTELEASENIQRNMPGSTLFQKTSRLANRIRSGQNISPDEIYQAFQPMMRDISPLFEKIRVKEQSKRFDRLIGELAREYKLNDSEQADLKKWFDQRANENARNFRAVIRNPDATLYEFIKASEENQDFDGYDEKMEGLLSGDDLERFRSQNLEKNAKRVQREVDGKLKRLDDMVNLTEEQKDELFVQFAKNSEYYEPDMGFEGTGEVGANDNGSFKDILSADQQQMFENEKNLRRQKAEKEMNSIGLTLPADWDILNFNDF